MRIRPCIDIHNGKVKQIVGGSLRDESGKESVLKESVLKERLSGENPLRENFVSQKDADVYAAIYRRAMLPGGHIILLNSVKEKEAYEADLRQAFLALKEYPDGMQAGGGITPETADRFLEAGASHVIVTSYVFRDGELDREHLDENGHAALADAIYDKITALQKGLSNVI